MSAHEAYAQELSLQNISNLLWAYAVLGAVPERLAAACVRELKRRLPHEPFTLQQLTNLLWSLCLAQVRLGAPGLPELVARASTSPPLLPKGT